MCQKIRILELINFQSKTFQPGYNATKPRARSTGENSFHCTPQTQLQENGFWFCKEKLPRLYAYLVQFYVALSSRWHLVILKHEIFSSQKLTRTAPFLPFRIWFFWAICLRNHLSRRRDSYKGYFTHVRNFGLQDLLPCPSYVIISKPPQSPPPQKKMTFTLIILNVVEHPRT